MSQTLRFIFHQPLKAMPDGEKEGKTEIKNLNNNEK